MNTEAPRPAQRPASNSTARKRVREAAFAPVAHRGDAVDAAVRQAQAKALRDAADEFRTDAASAWGDTAAWLTTGAHVANLAAEWLDDSAAAIEAGDGP